VIKGQKFFYKTNGTQFYIKGVAYQPDYETGSSNSANGVTDPLATLSGCQRDLPYLQALDTNVVRVYSVDLSLDHTGCMNLFAGAGIYVLLDLESPSESIISSSPAWNVDLYNRYTNVVDSFANYTNLLGFVAGNEVVTNSSQTDAAPFVKAAARDMKAYIKSKNYREIGVGYATNDNPDIRVNLANYMNCGDQTDAIDFWGYNVYSWCGDSTFQQSGYADRTNEFRNYSIPSFFAEYGCNQINGQVQPRSFSDVPVIYGPQMDDVWSGAIVYEYFEEANSYGLVTVSGNSISTLGDYGRFESVITKATPTGVNAASYTPSNSPQACPTQNSIWAAASQLPPTPDSNLCDCMFKTLSCVPSSSLNSSDYGTLFGYVCGLQGGKFCSGIAANATTGNYGAYGMCSPEQQLGNVLNAYYKGNSNQASACAFGGSATIQSAASATGTCSSSLSSAAAHNTATAQPMGSSGSGSNSASHSPSTGAAPLRRIGGFDIGSLLGAFVAQLAVISVIGMVVL